VVENERHDARGPYARFTKAAIPICVLFFADVKTLAIAKPALLMAIVIPTVMLGLGFFTIAPHTYYPRYIINNTGDWGLRFLVLTLCVTPVRRLTGWHRVIQLRRPLGLAAFFYSAAHLLLWAYWDWSFQLRSMLDHILANAFLWTGMIAFLLLLPLAVTSNRASMSQLGRRWRKLHWLTYVATLPTLAHFWLRGPFAVIQVRKWIAIVVVLLGFRLLVTWRQRVTRPPEPTFIEPATREAR
jgi:sulfoxide reductase heme-binding subunit YedZ